MKKYLFYLLVLFSQSFPAFSESWVFVNKFYENGPFTRYIDVESIKEKGSWKYANMRVTSRDGESIKEIRVDCKKGLYLFPIDYLNKTDFIQIRRIKNNFWVTDGIGLKRDEFRLEKVLDGMENKKSSFNGDANGTYNLLCKNF